MQKVLACIPSPHETTQTRWLQYRNQTQFFVDRNGSQMKVNWLEAIHQALVCAEWAVYSPSSSFVENDRMLLSVYDVVHGWLVEDGR
ncbi:hypothetical protein DMENIID0001_012100 [Sergentomyia squamirostris]